MFRAYFGGQFDENNVRENFVLIYELLDGTNSYKNAVWDRFRIDQVAGFLQLLLGAIALSRLGYLWF